jgi:predicted methyltransferase
VRMLSVRFSSTPRASRLRGLALAPVLALAAVAPAQAELDWTAALEGEHRSEKNAARDAFRHPRETLEFFGLREDMTVVELSPGGGWYTEVLAPLLAPSGNYYAAHYSVNGGSYARRALGRYLQKLGENDDVYGKVTVTTLSPPSTVVIAPPGSADMVLAFRNVHSWMGSDSLAEVFVAAFDALKPGGVFGVVQHRASDGRDIERMKDTGYVSEDHVIAAARSVGFELGGRSEINANPRDTGQWEGGVWELPPSLAGDEADREARLAIGESDRMTLKFVKPAK